MTKEEAIRRLEGGAPFSELYDEEWENALITAIEALKTEPIKHGRWIKITQEWGDYAEYFCSCCWRKIKAPFTLNPAWAFPYCHCGAKMDAQEVAEIINDGTYSAGEED